MLLYVAPVSFSLAIHWTVLPGRAAASLERSITEHCEVGYLAGDELVPWDHGVVLEEVCSVRLRAC